MQKESESDKKQQKIMGVFYNTQAHKKKQKLAYITGHCKKKNKKN